MRCPYCGAEVNKKICEYCDSDLSDLFVEQPEIKTDNTGNAFNNLNTYDTSSHETTNNMAVSDKSRQTALILCVVSFFVPGLHRFYTGKIGSALLLFFSAGFSSVNLSLGLLFGIVRLLINITDLVIIANGKFKDSKGRYLK